MRMRLPVLLACLGIGLSAPGALGAAWTTPEPIPGADGGWLDNVVTRPDGSAVIFWSVVPDARHASLYGVVRSAAGTYGAPTLLDSVSVAEPNFASLSQVDAASDAAGNLTVVWQRSTLMLPDVDAVLRLLTVPAGTTSLGDAETVATSNSSHALAVAPSGEALLAWMAGSTAKIARRSSATGSFGTPIALMPSVSGEIRPIALAFAPDSSARVLATQGGSNFALFAARIAPDDTQSAPEELVGHGSGWVHFVDPVLGIAPSGRATVAVGRNDIVGFPPSPWTSDNSILIASAAPGEVGTGAGGAVPARLGTDLLVAWTRVTEDDSSVLELARYDATAPSLSVEVPSAARPGESLTMTAQAGEDRWSSVGSIGWDFGDGQNGSGPSVSHAYGTAGEYTVTASVADGNGNVRRVRRRVVVATPAAPVPPALPTADRTPPVITNLALSEQRFRVDSGATALASAKKRAPRGSDIGIGTSESARVVLTFHRLVPGAPRGGKCKAGAKPRRGQKRCAAKVAAGELKRTVAGALFFAFSGRIGTKALKPGRYVLTAVANDAAGNRSAPKSVGFRIVT
jgi:hypothetical protein